MTPTPPKQPAPTCARCGTTTPYDQAQGWIESDGERYCSWMCVYREGGHRDHKHIASYGSVSTHA